MIKTKKELVIIGLILLMIIAIVGVSYAAFRFTGEGTKVNTITTGSITMTYEETSNTISLNGALPTTDATGKALNDYFDFTVSSQISGDVNINYEISAKDVTGSDGKKIDGSNIKLYLTRLTDDGEEELMIPETYNEEESSNSYTGRPAGEMSLYTSSMNSSESNRYRLRMWVDEDYNPQGDGGNLSFSVQINVYGLDGLSMEDRMMKAYVSGEDFHTDEYRSNITSIVTKGDTVIPEGVIESWDISEKQNGSVIAYIEDDGSGAGTYKLTIGGEGSIIANYNMAAYFYFGFTKVETIDLTYLDTSLTTDMSAMFRRCTSLETLNVKSFNTINVTDMTNFVAECSNLISLDLSNFNTSNVTDMGGMFRDCTNLTTLNIGSFNTSKVTNMNNMFGDCNSLKSLDLRNFDTSNVTSMETMFNNCTSLEYLNVTSFNTSKVTNMGNLAGAIMQLDFGGMFGNCSSLKSLDLRSFDTSNVTNMYGMFLGTTNLTEIIVSKSNFITDQANTNNILKNSGVTDFTYV